MGFWRHFFILFAAVGKKYAVGDTFLAQSTVVDKKYAAGGKKHYVKKKPAGGKKVCCRRHKEKTAETPPHHLTGGHLWKPLPSPQNTSSFRTC